MRKDKTSFVKRYVNNSTCINAKKATNRLNLLI